MKLISIFLFLISFSSYCFDLSDEVSQLNREYGNALDYPIIIFDKKEIVPLVKNLNENDARQVIIQYIKEKFDVTVSENEAHNLLPYFTSMNASAVALPFFEDYFSKKMKFCAVLPNGVENDLPSEVKRILGFDPAHNGYGNFDFKEIEKLFTIEELRLFSLYHELSHCLDKHFLPDNYIGEPSAHGVHLSESFAEVNALFLLAQRKELNKLGTKRSILRTVYTKHMGPLLANGEISIFGGPLLKAGGVIYFLSPVLIAGQRMLENFRRKVLDLDLLETLELSREVVEHHGINSRSFQAFVMTMSDGVENTQKHYKKMATLAPDLFLATYQDLLYFNLIIDESL